MRDEIIEIRPFQFVDYIMIEGIQKMGGHSVMKISGHIKTDKESEYLELLASNIWVHVEACLYSGIHRKLFVGIISEGNIKKENGLCLLTLTIVSGSYLMDRVRHIRSFQSDGITFESILNTISKEYVGHKYYMTIGQYEKSSGLILQYQETDWQFLRRIASYLGTDICSDCYGEGVRFWFGIPDGVQTVEVATVEYCLKRRGSTCGYSVTLREIYNIGEKVILNGIPLCVIERRTRLVGSELYHTYYLIRRTDFKINKKYNEKCIGAALLGTVTAVEKDKVQVLLDTDENKEKAGKRWFTYATPYSTPDGTGWYCMPEIGDCIRLRVPTEKEAEAYVENAVHLDAVSGSERVNPDYKSLMNKQGKEILFTPHSLIMTNNAGLSIEMLDNEGIKIISNKDVIIQAQNAIEMTSTGSKLELYAKENLVLKQGNTQFDMSGKTSFNGAKLNLN